MRTIKFRAKSLEGHNIGEWVFGDLHIRSVFPHIHTEVGTRCKIDTNTIGEFTGLYDKSGNEIYEGDIAKVKEVGGYGLEFFGVVRYYEKDCRFGIDTTHEYFKRILFTDGEINEQDANATITYTHEYEVLGNIHDNPELLKGGNK